jgi:O-acetyl-ADP-ribose deacetylase (regulator of RNase III)
MKIKKGCLIEAAKGGEVNLIMLGCNCFSTWGSGLNKQAKMAFPEAFAADKDDYRAPSEKIGSYSYYSYENLIVINLYTQYDYGTDFRRFEYGSLKRSVECVSRDFVLQNRKIGLPRIGSGLGGGNPVIIESMLESELGEYDVTIYER